MTAASTVRGSGHEVRASLRAANLPDRAHHVARIATRTVTACIAASAGASRIAGSTLARRIASRALATGIAAPSVTRARIAPRPDAGIATLGTVASGITGRTATTLVAAIA